MVVQHQRCLAHHQLALALRQLLLDFLEALLPLAEQFCPTKAQVANPIDYSEIPERAKGCPGMNPLNQREEVVA